MTLIWIRKYWGNKNWWGCQRCIQGRVGGDGSFLYKWNAGLRGGLCLPQDCFFSWIYSMINNITSSKAHWKWGKDYNIVNHQTAWTHVPAWAVGVLFHRVMQFAATLARNSEPPRRFLLKEMNSASSLAVFHISHHKNNSTVSSRCFCYFKTYSVRPSLCCVFTRVLKELSVKLQFQHWRHLKLG